MLMLVNKAYNYFYFYFYRLKYFHHFLFIVMISDDAAHDGVRIRTGIKMLLNLRAVMLASPDYLLNG